MGKISLVAKLALPGKAAGDALTRVSLGSKTGTAITAVARVGSASFTFQGWIAPTRHTVGPDRFYHRSAWPAASHEGKAYDAVIARRLPRSSRRVA